MSRRKAFVNATVYLGSGNSIRGGHVVCSGGRIDHVGGPDRLAAAGDIETIDLGGGLIIPGLVDSHIHLVGYALALARIDLSGTHSLQDGLELISSHVKSLPKGSWLCGRGWDKQRWDLATFPTRYALDEVTSGHPAALVSRDGHLVWINTEALKGLGLEDGMGGVEGGEVERDGSGRPTGIFKERAAGLVLERTEKEDPEHARSLIEAAARRLVGLGLTAVHTIENEHQAVLLDCAADKASLGLNLFRLREISELDDLDGLRPSSNARCIKIMADGTLGSQTASMLEPYCGQPGNRGIASVAVDRLREMVGRSVKAGFAVAVHAIGDRANRDVLDVYEEVRTVCPPPAVVLRVEHAQVLRERDIPRFGGIGVIASMQPVHIVADMAVADKYWGKRAEFAYVWRSIMEAGGVVAFGSDAPIEDPDPLKGLHAAVTRRCPDEPGSPAWNPAQCLEVAQAIDCYSAGAARAAGMHGIAGEIRVGRRADLTLLDTDILAAPDPDAILEARVVGTVIGGRVFGPA